MPTDLRSTLRDLALSYATQIVWAVRTSSMRELFEPEPAEQGVARRRRGGKRPKAPVAGTGELKARIQELRGLAAQPASDATRYAMGAIVKELKRHPETYGDNAVSVAAAAAGEDAAGLYRFATVAERWSAREVSALLAFETVTWSHLVALARVESRPVRERFLRRIRRERLPLKKLVAALEAERAV